MIIYDLICECGFEIEGWFSSLEDYQRQADKKQINCPFCSSNNIIKKPSAPYINQNKNDNQFEKGEQKVKEITTQEPSKIYEGVATRPRKRDQAARSIIQSKDKKIAELSQALGKIIEVLIKSSENVGSKFVEEARKIHNNQAPMRSIRGEATIEEFYELQDEGIDCIPLPIPAKKDLN